MTMFKTKHIETTGEVIVAFALTGQHGSGDYLLTPADCQLILEECDFTRQDLISGNNPTKNRKLREPRLEKYERGFSKEVIDTGASIIFDTNGHLIDGKHRLTTVIRLGINFPTLVAFGRSTKAFAVIDGQMGSRNLCEVFEMSSIPFVTITTSATTWLMRYKANHFSLNRGVRSFTPLEVLEYYQTKIDKDLMIECIRLADRVYKQSGIYTTPLTVIMYLVFKHGDKATGEAFMKGITGGERKGRFKCVEVLLKYLMKITTTPGMYIQNRQKLALVIYTWNCFFNKKASSFRALNNAQTSIRLELGKKG